MSAAIGPVRVGDTLAWRAYLASADAARDDVFAQKLAADVVLPGPLPSLGIAANYAIHLVVESLSMAYLTRADRVAHDLYVSAKLPLSPFVRDTVDALLPEAHAERLTTRDVMQLARAAAAWAWSRNKIDERDLEDLALAFAMPAEALHAARTAGESIAEMSERFAVSRAHVEARIASITTRATVEIVKAPTPRAERARVRRLFERWYGGPLCDPVAGARWHADAFAAWHASDYGHAARDRLRAVERMAMMLPHGTTKLRLQIERDRRRIERAPTSGVHDVGAAQ